VTFAALGDRAIRFPVAEGVNRRLLVEALRRGAGVVDVVIAEDLGAVTFSSEDDRARAQQAVLAALEVAAGGHAPAPPPREHVVPVAYDGEDLEAIAAASGLARDEVIARHATALYTVAMLGFLPGFAYLRGLDPALVLPRRSTPRARVPARSVAIAAEYTGIYPFASPGGWHLLGTSSIAPFGGLGAAFALGDHVRFEPTPQVPRAERPRHAPAPPPPGPHVEITRLAGPALLVDAGRKGHMHEGVPPGGPLVRTALARANRAAGNDAAACAIETFGAITVAARGGRVAAADDTGRSVVLEDGAALTLAPDRTTRVRYVAVEGGFDVPIVLGGRGTLLVAQLGGLFGRPLLAGDHLATGGAGPALGPVLADESDGPVAVTLGPDDVGDDAQSTLLDATFAISPVSDRVGTRLEGPPVVAAQPATARRSGPMVLGAIQVTPSGLVVLGPDHPTTGGYPVIAVVRASSRDAFFAKPPGASVRFTR
jgi:KipI family sensor histidine kinase inhibitor